MKGTADGREEGRPSRDRPPVEARGGVMRRA